VLPPPGPDLLVPVAVALPGSTVYMPNLSEGPRYGAVQSELAASTVNAEGPAACTPSSADIGAVSAPVVDLSLLFTPPFKLD
jgi:hypothetical protein